jgi:hypothetical protein
VLCFCWLSFRVLCCLVVCCVVWLCVVHMAMCLQTMVEEMIRLKGRKDISVLSCAVLCYAVLSFVVALSCVVLWPADHGGRNDYHPFLTQPHPPPTHLTTTSQAQGPCRDLQATAAVAQADRHVLPDIRRQLRRSFRCATVAHKEVSRTQTDIGRHTHIQRETERETETNRSTCPP